MPVMLIKNAVVILPDRLLSGHCILCKSGKIVDILPQGYKDVIVDEVFDAKGSFLAPGLIDLHIHGIHQFLVDSGADDLSKICTVLPQYGVTSFLPTVCPLPKGKDSDFLRQLAWASTTGAQILGFHLEGPFLAKTGALPPEAIGKADPVRVRALIEAAKPYPAIFSVSPDFENVCELITIMAENDRPVFITHTAANVEQTQKAIAAGACHATHFYDVFHYPPVIESGVRPCGTLETILADPKVSVDFILDGVHVESVAVQMALVCKGPDRVCLITDANVGAGLPPGRYKALGSEIEFAYEGSPARMTENAPYPGGLAGSGLTMDKAVRNAVELLKLSIPQAVRMASTNPAQVLRLTDKGQIKKGFDADLILLDDHLNVLKTWVKGKCQYSNKF